MALHPTFGAILSDAVNANEVGQRASERADIELAAGLASLGMDPAQAAEYADAHSAARDPRDPDPSRTGIFRGHNCWRCQSGVKPCVNGTPDRCEYPRARND